MLPKSGPPATGTGSILGKAWQVLLLAVFSHSSIAAASGAFYRVSNDVDLLMHWTGIGHNHVVILETDVVLSSSPNSGCGQHLLGGSIDFAGYLGFDCSGSGAEVVLVSDITFTNSQSGISSAFYAISKSMTFRRCMFQNIHSSLAGGAAVSMTPVSTDVTLSLYNSTFVNCSAPKGGAVLFENTNISDELLGLDLQWVFRTHHPKGATQFRIAQGQKEGQNAIIWEIAMTSRGPDVGDFLNQSADWLEAAHQMTDDWFFKLIDGELLEKYR